MQPIKWIIILGVSILLLGVFLIAAGYGTSMTSFWFGVYFVLVGALFAVALPVLTPYIKREYIQRQPPPPPLPDKNTGSNGPAAPGALATSASGRRQPRVDGASNRPDRTR
ncbi:MAG TPA: hypothetical protein VFR55_14490 [Dehalococcoidia bacterium]|nr:hypothetical protein [Dehalococcoidia bacterium]